MFDQETLNRLKNLAKEQGTTQSSLISECVRWALDNADISDFDLVPAKKRGRKAKPKVVVEEETEEFSPALADTGTSVAEEATL